jgi:hypothetical protein
MEPQQYGTDKINTNSIKQVFTFLGGLVFSFTNLKVCLNVNSFMQSRKFYQQEKNIWTIGGN